MMNPIARSIYSAALIGVLYLDGAVLTHAQGTTALSPAAAQTNVSDQELQAFAPVYLDYQRIRNSYETRIGKIEDARKRKRFDERATEKAKRR